MGLKRRNDLKTRATQHSVNDFVDTVVPSHRRDESRVLIELMSRVSGAPAVLWGTRIIGFSSYHYEGSGGRQGEWMRLGFAAGKNVISIYCIPGFKNYGALLRKIGPHKHSVSCLYIKRLSDVDLNALEALLKQAFADMKRMYPR